MPGMMPGMNQQGMSSIMQQQQLLQQQMMGIQMGGINNNSPVFYNY
jgi:hypothetical protein